MITNWVTTMVSERVCDRPVESSTRAVKVKLDAAVGVPDTTPAALSATPFGSEPDARVQA